MSKIKAASKVKAVNNSKAKAVFQSRNSKYGVLTFYCPFCKDLHCINVSNKVFIDKHRIRPSYDYDPYRSRYWTWNRSLTSPTVYPCIIAYKRGGEECHSYLRNGKVNGYNIPNVSAWKKLMQQKIDRIKNKKKIKSALK
jgi:hypothetical protein